MNRRRLIGSSAWAMWLGVTGILIVVAWLAGFDARAVLDGAVPADYVGSRESMQRGLRIAFLLIAAGAACRLPRPRSRQQRWAVGAALAVLICGVAGDIGRILVRPEWTSVIDAGLGSADSLQQRLIRLGAMAAYAVPMMTLLAAGECQHGSGRETGGIAALLVRWEVTLFAVGTSTLPSLLIAAALIHRELTWLAAVGADASVAACAAAAIRARWRRDRLALAGWLLVCGSMAVGLLMGIYSLGGPVPAPTLFADYNALPRVLLRDGHVIVLAIGIAGIVVAFARRADRGAT